MIMDKRYMWMKAMVCTLLLLFFFASCQERNNPEQPLDPPGTTDTPVDTTAVPQDSADVSILKNIAEMSLREKVGQLFNIRLEVLNDGRTVMEESGRITANYKLYPCGGFTIFAKNLLGPKQLTALSAYLHGLGNYPLLCIDEEGGLVARIGNSNYFNVQTYSSMYEIGLSGNPQNAYDAGYTIGSYLYTYGLDVDFAPVADVWTNPQNTVIGKRAFSTDPNVVAIMTEQFNNGLKKRHVIGCYKHFPGHGDTGTDSHYGYAEAAKTWDEMKACELIPFQNGIDNGVEMIMAAHISCPNVTGSAEPATVSHLLLTDKLRTEMGFQGIIITDGMEMGAITSQYSSAEAAILAIQAGADIILLPADYFSTFDAVVAAVENGTIPESRIDESVARILTLKEKILVDRNIIW